MGKPAAYRREKPAWLRNGCRTLGRVMATAVRGDMVRLTVKVPGWPGAVAGQFALLQAESSHCFLGRALSISDQTEAVLSFIVAPVGEGTKELCSLRKGSPVWIIGPMGSGYDSEALTDGPIRILMVGGGVGLAPFPLLLGDLERRLVSKAGSSTAQAGSSGRYAASTKSLQVLVLVGFRDEKHAKGAEWLREAIGSSRRGESGLIASVEISTEDGSVGSKGKVTDLVEKHLRPGDRLAVCGPESMAREIWRMCVATNDVKAWFSLEANVACGAGSCHGCVITLADGSYARVCREGPVFPGEAVFDG